MTGQHPRDNSAMLDRMPSFFKDGSSRSSGSYTNLLKNPFKAKALIRAPWVGWWKGPELAIVADGAFYRPDDLPLFPLRQPGEGRKFNSFAVNLVGSRILAAVGKALKGR
jgi:hypothetical protein